MNSLIVAVVMISGSHQAEKPFKISSKINEDILLHCMEVVVKVYEAQRHSSPQKLVKELLEEFALCYTKGFHIMEEDGTFNTQEFKKFLAEKLSPILEEEILNDCAKVLDSPEETSQHYLSCFEDKMKENLLFHYYLDNLKY